MYNKTLFLNKANWELLKSGTQSVFFSLEVGTSFDKVIVEVYNRLATIFITIKIFHYSKYFENQ